MNIFRFLGDLSHIVSFLVLLHKIIKGKSSAGISLRTQELYAGVLRLRSAALWTFACGVRTPATCWLHDARIFWNRWPLCGALGGRGGGGGAIDLRGAALAVRSRLLQPVH